MSNRKWSVEEDEEADWYVKSPDGHRFYFGNIESISKCCFDNAKFIVEACNRYIEEPIREPKKSTYSNNDS